MDRIAEVGLFEQLELHSRTSRYGQLTRLDELDRSGIQAFLREALEERIRTGRFDKEWAQTQESEEPVLERLLERVGEHPIVEAEARLREMLGSSNGKEE
jgi:ketol-acid reductoisomerase